MCKWCQNDVISTSMPCHHVAVTLIQYAGLLFSTTVKPVLRGHPREGQKSAAKTGEPLNTGSFSLCLASRDPEKVAGDPLIEVAT